MSDQKRPEWMQNISSIVDPEDYLLGRKIDKTFELSQQERAEKARELRASLVASDKLKLSGDPILDLQRRKERIKHEILTNPLRLRQFREFLKRREANQDDSKASTSRRSDRQSSGRTSSSRSERSRNHDDRHRKHRYESRDKDSRSGSHRHSPRHSSHRSRR